MIGVRQHRIFGLGKVTGRIRISNCRMLAEVNHYDFHARQLQLPIPHFYQQDPYADKYPHLSPYLYCAGNPLKYVDPSGKDVAVIKAKGSPGHLAMLVQDGNRWFYYSYNGTNVYELSSGSAGGKNYHDVGKKSFGDVMEF